MELKLTRGRDPHGINLFWLESVEVLIELRICASCFFHLLRDYNLTVPGGSRRWKCFGSCWKRNLIEFTSNFGVTRGKEVEWKLRNVSIVVTKKDFKYKAQTSAGCYLTFRIKIPCTTDFQFDVVLMRWRRTSPTDGEREKTETKLAKNVFMWWMTSHCDRCWCSCWKKRLE